MSSFDKEDNRSKFVVPKSINDGKIVKVSQKTVKTQKVVRKVLPEEQYIRKLDKIIEKDYFPELRKLQAQNEYLEAVANKDVTKIKELQMKFCSGASIRTDRSISSFRTPTTDHFDEESTREETPSETPFDVNTPGPSTSSKTSKNDWMNTPIPFANAEGDNEAIRKKKNKKNDMSLTGYLNKYTSEDNASFEELTQVMREREDAKRKWLYEAESEHNKNLVTKNAMALEADVQLALKYAINADESRPLAIDNWEYKAWNTVLFNPNGAPLTTAEAIDAAKKQQIEINRKATRFPSDLKMKPSDDAMNRAAMNQVLHNAGKVDVMGHEVTPSNAIKLLSTPHPDPEVMDSPLMTWGEIDGTPFRLDAPDISESFLASGSAPAFKIPEVPLREKIAQSMNDSIAAKYRDKRKVAMKAAEGAHRTPKFGSKRVADKIAQLSPAAQKLATKKLGLKMASKSPFLSPKSGGSTWRSSKTPGSNWSRGEKTPGSSWSQGARTPDVETMILKKNSKPTSSSSSSSSNDKSNQNRANAGDFF
ncbi:unnamed protein product [Caenorhabditis angaria]|uniref:Uncharacterized protein n=1 Tax=Caenorhabditis angaria TaxID=860376 RepID=A0A9P1N2G2_9PELO|nr:unnamed protein product [Caenorhabditis angaria]